MKYFGKIGFDLGSHEDPNRPGIWVEGIMEREYFGDVQKNYSRIESGESVNDNVNVSNTISILGDPFVNENIHSIRYAEFMGSKWKISTVDVEYPRLILTLGGAWNEHA